MSSVDCAQSIQTCEGWRLSESYGGDNPDPATGYETRIEREDSPADGSEPRFKDDPGAWALVVGKARAGSAYHIDALEACSAREQELIISTVGSWK